MKNKIAFFLVLAVVFVAGFYALNNYIYNEKQAEDEDPSISSYQECVDAGYPVLDSYPQQCQTPSGKRFVRNLPEKEIADFISTIVVHGQLVCLPHWNTEGPQTLECAFGMQDNAGNYYVLSGGDPSVIGSTNSLVTITGTYTPGSSERYQSIGTIEVKDVAEWEAETDEAQRMRYQFPEGLTNYVVMQERPVVEAAEGGLGCDNPRIINEKDYCVEEETEGAAGSVYNSYTYATVKDGQLFKVSFTLQYPQCDNYDEPESSECEDTQAAMNTDGLADQVMQSAEHVN